MRNNNNNPRHMRPRNNNNNGRNNNGSNNNGNNSNNGNNGGKRVNPRIQTFDSNGPDVRVRGTAYQISDKYLTLAKDAASAGDRILAESYLQHAEHYQRFINEMTERFEQYRPQTQPGAEGRNAEEVADDEGAAGAEEPLNDLDQSFLVGNSVAVQKATDDAGGAEVLSLTGIVTNQNLADEEKQAAPMSGDEQPPEVKDVRKRRVLTPKTRVKSAESEAEQA